MKEKSRRCAACRRLVGERSFTFLDLTVEPAVHSWFLFWFVLLFYNKSLHLAVLFCRVAFRRDTAD